jgi:hypothetical protein
MFQASLGNIQPVHLCAYAKGDQMSLRKYHPKRSPSIFLSELMHDRYFGKSYFKN